MDVLQQVIHKIEVAGGMRHLRKILSVLLLLALVMAYNWRGFRNMATQEAMDSAQLGRNLAEGKGFTTGFIRPFSMYLQQQHNRAQHIAEPSSLDVGKAAEWARLEGGHPDIANPPAYPLLLAGLMKVLPFDHNVSTTKTFWSYGNRFWRYQPDFLISLFNQALFLLATGLVFLLARRVFDKSVAWLSALIMLGTEFFWRFSVSGLSTMLLLVLFLALAWCLVLVEAETREPRGGPARLLMLAIFAGLLAGVGALTRYSFGWLMLPVVLFLAVYAGHQRVRLASVALLAFIIVFFPWIVRNYSVCGAPFGVSGYAIYEDSSAFPGHRLQTSLEPDLSQPMFGAVERKFFTNLRRIVQEDLPRLGGSWLAAFFLVGLLVIFSDPAITRLRHFLLACLAVLVLVQAFARTQLSDDSPDINSENLLVLLAPLVLVYGVSLFLLLLEQLRLPNRQLNVAAMSAFAVVICLPLLLSFLPPRTVPIAYPPYFPPALQKAATWVKEDELTASDMPWALAWYGGRQSIWTASPADFLSINDYQKQIRALLLTPLTMEKSDTVLLGRGLAASDQAWTSVILQSASVVLSSKYPSQDTRAWPMKVNVQVRGERPGAPPLVFPLHNIQGGWPDTLLLTLREQAP